MLVVIAIIGILAALLFPVYSRAQAQAKRTACLDNLRQLDTGLKMYCDDSNDTSPTTGHARFGTQAWSSYRESMKTYVGVNGQSSPKDKIFDCPADTFYIEETKVGAFLYQSSMVRSNLYAQPLFDYSSYAFNGGTEMRSFAFASSPGISGLKLSSIKEPAKTVLLAEAPAFYPFSWHDRSPKGFSMPVGGGTVLFDGARNMVGFVDGHVSYTKIYWNTNANSPGTYSLAMQYDPPPGYDYKWSGD